MSTLLKIIFLVIFRLSLSGNLFPEINAATYSYGDVNGDGSIDALDSALFKMYLLNSISTFPVADGSVIADLGGDKSVTALDFSLIKQYLLGLINKFSVKSITPVVNIPWDWACIIGTGQSLSVGAQASPVTTTQPYHNLKLSLGSLNIRPYDYNSSQLKIKTEKVFK